MLVACAGDNFTPHGDDDTADAAEEDDDDTDDAERCTAARTVVNVESAGGNPFARRVSVHTDRDCEISGFVTTEGESGFGPSNPSASGPAAFHELWFFGLLPGRAFHVAIHVAGDPEQILAESDFETPAVPAGVPMPDRFESAFPQPDDAPWIAAWVAWYTLTLDAREIWVVIFDRRGRLRFAHRVTGETASMLMVADDGTLVLNDQFNIIGVRPDGTQSVLLRPRVSPPHLFPMHHQIHYATHGPWRAVVLFNELGDGLKCDGVTPTEAAVGDGLAVVDDKGAEIFRWSIFDHLDAFPQSVPVPFSCLENHWAPDTTDWTHGNAAAPVAGENAFLVSLRNLSRVVKIDGETGDIVWQLGRGLDFTWIGDEPDAERWFGFQHDAQSLPGNRVLLFDNAYAFFPDVAPHELWSRALELELDEEAMTARRVFEHRVPVSLILGSADRGENGHTLVSTGSGATAEDVTSDGKVIWKIRYDDVHYALTARFYPPLWNDGGGF
ncbi:MAG: aryl-sulfate sulfotransferase [Deltaproteobacteria bacterium]|nr:aryl-sulfate sulfotransferase [Deltaproteobacteria bacterium]